MLPLCYRTAMTGHIDLNADLGESFGRWTLGEDAALLPQLSSANLACGFHAGDPLTVQRSVALAQRHGVAIGAHPSFPDLVGFGRRELGATPDEIYADVLYQLGAVAAFLRVAGAPLHHVKAHGALYLEMLRDAPTAAAVAQAVFDFDPTVPLVVLAGPGGEKMAAAAQSVGVSTVLEAFPDRNYQDDGRLTPRTEPGAVLEDPQEIAGRARQMAAEGTVTSRSGQRVSLAVQTLCLHGDRAGVAAAARAVRSALAEAGLVVATY